MRLTKRQRHTIRKLAANRSPGEIASQLTLPETEILEFLNISEHPYKTESFGNSRTSNVSDVIRTGRFGGFGPLIRQNWMILGLIAVLIFTVYANGITGEFVSDDIFYIVNSVKSGSINSFSFVTNAPLTFIHGLITYTVYHLFGLNPAAFRIVNIIFHIGTTWCLFLLLALCSNIRVATIAGLIYAVHPILTESVTWIGGGGYVKLSFFFLLSLLTYIPGRNSHKWMVFSIFSYILMLLTSEKSIPLAILFPLFEYSFGNLKKNWKLSLPYFALSAAWTLMMLTVFRYLQNRISALTTNYYQGTDMYNPLIQIPTAISWYLQLLFIPDRLSFYHSDLLTGQTDYLIRSGVFILFLSAIIFFAFKYLPVFFFLIILPVSLSPSLTPLRIAWIVAERYAYLGAAGVIVAIAYGIDRYVRHKYNPILWSCMGLVILGLSTRTVIRNNDWKTADSLWIATARTAPSDPKTHNNLGDMYSRQGNMQKAIEEFSKAIELHLQYADAYHNLGMTYFRINKYDDAEKNLQLAIKYNPQIWQSRQLLAAIEYNREKYSESLEYLKQALEITPNNPLIYANLGTVYRKLNRNDEARNAFTEALRLEPNNADIKKMMEQNQ